LVGSVIPIEGSGVEVGAGLSSLISSLSSPAFASLKADSKISSKAASKSSFNDDSGVVADTFVDDGLGGFVVEEALVNDCFGSRC